MTDLSNATIFITGATSGIGRSCALAFAHLGGKLLVCGRRRDRLDELHNALLIAGAADVHAIELDVRNRGRVSDIIEGLPQEWGGIDILINNAGLSRGLDTIQDGLIDDWEEMIDTNIKGLLYISRAVLPGMIARGRGHIINIGSIAGHQIYPKGNVYCGTKHAVRAITEAMQLDLHGTGVRITTVDPGLVETEFSEVRFHGDTARASAVYHNTTPLTPEDVAETVVFCATRPPHVSIHEIVLMPAAQASATMVLRT